MRDYPREYFLSITGNTDLEVSIIIGFEEYKSSYWVECNLLMRENRKIFRFLGKKFNIQDEDLAYSEGVKIYRDFLDSD